MNYDYDYIIIGSGFGGSVSALRLSEKGYNVLVIEKGKWWKKEDFPKTIWNLKKWLWAPLFKFYGIMRITMLRHVYILSGVGVGGGSLVYANTLPVPKEKFYTSDSWSHLADWEAELKDYYPLALRMLGAAPSPRLEVGDLALKQMADDIGRSDHFHKTNVSIYFGKPGEPSQDPYFDGDGPERSGCTFCGGCMVGCRYKAKNTLDKNYLYLAQKKGAKVQAESLVVDVSPINKNDGEDGYQVFWENSTSKFFKKKGSFKTKGVIFAGGVLGSVKLLLKLKRSSLPSLSDKLGSMVRTNSEALMPITSMDRKSVFSDGIAIGSILNTDENTHVEPVRYSEGSGFWRLLVLPRIEGNNILSRFTKLVYDLIRHPINNLKIMFVDDWAKRTQVLLFMQTIDSTLNFSEGLLNIGLKSGLGKGDAPTAFIPQAKQVADHYAKLINGKATALWNESLFGIPSTAHILGGACMGKDSSEGVIDKDNHIFGYKNMMVCDGAMISANPGVNPSLTITALTERAMSKIQPKI
ncbi:MAG: NAD(P)-binding protein [Candidatus Marinimicrobia bacterium]|nr:NAD(P)-binding protein [Candidatus Neomarinimicrobiota bacterium]MBL7009699.1 NAD(P)-binding protein [Candidatus Neomarinimicrobiota bacterium]MBL7029558.1 NAD(P)-binding protein [Candidatus Neomarinimicrobiota bacterium]